MLSSGAMYNNHEDLLLCLSFAYDNFLFPKQENTGITTRILDVSEF